MPEKLALEYEKQLAKGDIFFMTEENAQKVREQSSPEVYEKKMAELNEVRKNLGLKPHVTHDTEQPTS